jgi:hypothetical protein
MMRMTKKWMMLLSEQLICFFLFPDKRNCSQTLFHIYGLFSRFVANLLKSITLRLCEIVPFLWILPFISFPFLCNEIIIIFNIYILRQFIS